MCIFVKMQRLILCTFIFSLHYVSADNSTNLCNSLLTCGECIQSPICAWCSEEDTNGTPRCFRPNLKLSYISEHCSEEHVYFPTNTIHLHESFKSQLKPQKIDLQLKVNEPLYFSVYFHKADNNTDLSFELNDNSSKYLNVRYISKCLGNYTTKNFQCNNSTSSRHVHFFIEVNLKTCPKQQDNAYEHFNIYLQNSTESVKVKVEMFCTCPCEQPGSMGYQLKSRKCNAVGTLKCGTCQCDSLHTGRNCECSLEDYSKIGCNPSNSTAELECSGRGVCICNQCECNTMENIRKKITGHFCECDNFSCNRHNGRICSGNGVCTCGKCSCRSRYTGDACECYTGTTYCYPPFKKGEKICSGHGDCVCGKCRCNKSGDKKYFGRFCEKCLNCTHTCEKLEPCVLCQLYQKGVYNDAECVEKCNIPITIVDEIRVNSTNNEFLCTGQDENGCAYTFIYQDINNYLHIRAPKMVQCL